MVKDYNKTLTNVDEFVRVFFVLNFNKLPYKRGIREIYSCGGD
jgi:hypothetical protein